MSRVSSTEVETRAESATATVMAVQGAWRFAIVGIAAFLVWALFGRWFHAHTGDAGLYTATAAVFIALSGLLLHPLVAGRGGARRFYRVFIPAFLAYAVVWSISWFLLRFGAGEWLGSAAGSAAFVAIAGWRLGNLRPFLKALLVFFIMNSCGYFLGGLLMHFLARGGGAGLLASLGRTGAGVAARLAWGLVFGLGFGAGLGYTFHVLQKEE